MNPQRACSTSAAIVCLLACCAGAIGAQQDAALPPVNRGGPATRLSTAPSVLLKEFRFEGNTRVSTAELQQKVAPFLNRRLTMEDLEEARRLVTLAYVEHDKSHAYINSGAVLPDQDVTSGVITFKIIEGKLTQVNLKVEGPRYVTDEYVRQRIEIGAASPLNVVDMRQALEVLRQEPAIARVNAELKPGLKPGESLLDVTVQEAAPYQLGLEFDNKRSPSVGGERFYVLASDASVTGHGDNLSLRYGLTRGGLEHIDWAGFDDFSAAYTLPITPYDTTIGVEYVRGDDLVIETPFQSVNITSKTESLALTLRHPFIKTPERELALSIQGARRYNQTFLMGQPFSFAPGQQNGRSDVTAIRLGQEYTYRTMEQLLALRSTFSIGIDALGATINRDRVGRGGSDSRFLAWLGQAQYVRKIPKTDAELIVRLASQLADNPLPAIEQFSIGGMESVRGYRENRLVRDNAVLGSAELRIPLLKQADRSILDLAPFIDSGYGWNVHSTSDAPREWISSAGIGLLFNPNRHLAVQIYYGVPFKRFKNSHDIQDKGLHFDVIVLAF